MLDENMASLTPGVAVQWNWSFTEWL